MNSSDYNSYDVILEIRRLRLDVLAAAIIVSDKEDRLSTVSVYNIAEEYLKESDKR